MVRFVSYILFLTIFSLLGCSVGPDYIPPEVTLPEHYSQSETKEIDLSSLSQYWQQFDDQTLNILVEKGLEKNLNLQQAYERVEQSLARLGLSKSEFLPDIDFSAGVERRRRSSAVASAIRTNTNDFISVGGFLNWELDLLGRLRRLKESAAASLEASIEEQRATRILLISQIASSYIDFRSTKALIELSKENVRTQKESLELASQLHKAGIVPEVDVFQAESNLGETEATVPSFRISHQRAKNRLAVLLGDLPQIIIDLLPESAEIPEIAKLNVDSLPLDVLTQRPDVRMAERNLASRHALIGAAKAEYFPIISLPGRISFEALNNFDKAFRADSLAYTLGPAVDLNLYDFGRVSNQVDLAESESREAELNYKEAVLIAVEEVENALVKISEEKIRTKSLQDSVKASKKSVELTKSLYKSGLTDFQNVLDIERRLFSQEINLAQSQSELAKGYVELYRALGGGWTKEEAPSDNA